MAKTAKVIQSVTSPPQRGGQAASPPEDPKKWKTEEVDPTALRPGDWIHLYGHEVARVIRIDKDKPEAGLVYEWKGRELTGLRPRKKGERVTRIRV